MFDFQKYSNRITIMGYIGWFVIPIGVIVLITMWRLGTGVLHEKFISETNANIAELSILEAETLNQRILNAQGIVKGLAKNELIVNGLIDATGRGSYLPAFMGSLSFSDIPNVEVTLLDYKGRLVYANTNGLALPQHYTNKPNMINRSHLELNKNGMWIIEPVQYLGNVEGALVMFYPNTTFPKLFGKLLFENHNFILNGENGFIYSSTSKISKLETEWKSAKLPIGDFPMYLVYAISPDRALRLTDEVSHLMGFGFVFYLCTSVIFILSIGWIVTNPLRNLSVSVAAIDNFQDVGARFDVAGPKEIHDLAMALNNMMSQLDRAAETERKLQFDLREAQKMEAIGQLAGGIAHEINTPAQYISHNLKFLQTGYDKIFSVIDSLISDLTSKNDNPALSSRCEKYVQELKDAKYDYLRAEVPLSIEQSLSGVNQVTKIVLAMKEFAHPSHKTKELVDINRVVENAVTISQSEWKHFASIKKNLAPTLPKAMCLFNEINQVLLNIIINASHALEEIKATADTGIIEISTRQSMDRKNIEISIRDNGPGIPASIRSKVYDPFFTTKPVGKGTGQGLAIVYDMVVTKHGGAIDIRPYEDGGTTVEICLPINDGKEIEG